MKNKMLAFILIFTVFAASAADIKKTASSPKLRLKYVAWDTYMLGIDTPAKQSAIRKSIKRIPVIGLISFSGINANTLKDNIEYVYGPKKHSGMHDTYQIYEVRQIAASIGLTVKVKVYHVKNLAQVAEALRLAGRESDVVITYSSYWSKTKPMLRAVAANPSVLYISPYVEIGKPRTNRCFQNGARHPDGSGLRNFITTIPLSRHKPSGKLLTPSCRDKNDTETINFVAPSSYASSAGETCPSAGVTAVAALYIASTSEKKISAEEIIQIMLKNTSLPTERMLKLSDFQEDSIDRLKESLNSLTQKDAVGIRRLEANGVIDLWKIYEYISAKK